MPSVAPVSANSRPNRSSIVCARLLRDTRRQAQHGPLDRPDTRVAVAPKSEEALVSRFTDKMYANARSTTKGMVTGEPHEPVRHTWGEVHERARRIAGGLAAAGVGPGEAVGVLAGAPVEIAPTAQGLWMRGASLTMLHQPTPRTDLMLWAEDTMNVVDMIEAKAVVVSDPFMAAVPVLEEKGLTVLTVADLLAAEPVDPVDTGEDDLALMQLTSGSTGSPKAVHITHRNLYANAEAMFIGAEYDVETDVMISWLPCFHDMGMIGFLTVPMYFGAELVKVTPMDFLRDTLLWAKLIDKYKGTMTAAPNFAYALFAKRLRNQAEPGQFDLSTLRFALSGAEPVEPADVEDLIDAGRPFGLRASAILPAYGMAEATLAVSFSECNAGLVVDEVDADLLAALRHDYRPVVAQTRSVPVSMPKAPPVTDTPKESPVARQERLRSEFQAERLEAALNRLTPNERRALEQDYVTHLEESQGFEMRLILGRYRKEQFSSRMVESHFRAFASARLVKEWNEVEFAAYVARLSEERD